MNRPYMAVRQRPTARLAWRGAMEALPQGVERAQYLTFHVADEAYGIDVLRVVEIVPFGMITKVPKTPAWIRGVILLRGQVVPVVDLAAKLGLSPITPAPATCIIVVEAEICGQRVVMGVTTDSVSEVIDLAKGDVAPPPVFGTRIRIEYLLGLGKTRKNLALLLDIDKVLSADEILAMADVATDAEAPASSGDSRTAEKTTATATDGI
jgi:purine-binding chemotaxis protein CheW